MVADRYGGKDILGFAVLWWSAATLVAPVARTVPLMITARIGFGIGESVTPSVLYSNAALRQPGCVPAATIVTRGTERTLSSGGGASNAASNVVPVATSGA